MPTPSPICEYKDGAGAWTALTNGGNVTPGNTVSVRLVSAAGADIWTPAIVATDETAPAPALTIDSVTKTFTFTAPAAGKAMRFRSRVQSSGDATTYDSTFGIYTLAASGNRVHALNETFESHGTYGWLSTINGLLRATNSAISWAGDLLGSSNASQIVVSLTGAAGFVPISANGAVMRWAAATVNPGRSQAQALSGGGSAMQDRTQAAAGASAAAGADYRCILGKSDGAGAAPSWRLAQESVAGTTSTDVMRFYSDLATVTQRFLISATILGDGNTTWKSAAGMTAGFGGNNGTQLAVTAAGKATLQSDSGQDTVITTAGAGNVNLAASGTGATYLGGRTRAITRNVAGNVTIDSGQQDVILFVSTAAARAITLPAASAGRMIIIKDSTGQCSVNNITITRAAGESIEGVAANRVLASSWGAWILICDGTNWFLMS